MEAAFLAILVLGVLVVIALKRTRQNDDISHRLTRLEIRLFEIEESLRSPHRQPTASTPVPVPSQTKEVGLQVGPPQPTAAARIPEPIVAAVPLPQPATSSVSPVRAEPPKSSAPVIPTEPPLSPWPPPPPRVPSSPPRPPIEWERWLGVRGAAVLGGAVFILAGILFFKYSIEHDLIPPVVRVALGTGVGVASIVTSEKIRRRYSVTSDALAGAGTAILYAAFWAAKVRYHLLGTEITFALMVLTTVASCLLSIRHGSLVLAVLGLLGGFATPFLLASNADNPVGLFGYLLLLDVGFLWIAYKRRWVILAVLSLAGTILLQALWVGLRMGPERLWLALGILGIFALVFAVGAKPKAGEDRETRTLWLTAQGAAVLVPFGFALYFASRSDWGPHFYPVGMLVLLLSVAACWVGRREHVPWLGLGAASANVAVVATWLFSAKLTPALTWEICGASVALALPFHVFVELDHKLPARNGASLSAQIAGFGLFALLVGAMLTSGRVDTWPWVAGWCGLAVILLRHAGFAGRERLHLEVAAALGVSLAALHIVHHGQTERAISQLLAVAVGLAIGFHGIALIRRNARAAEHAAALFPLLFLLSFFLPPRPTSESPILFFGVTLTLALLSMLASTRIGEGRWLFIAMLLAALVHTVWSVSTSADQNPAIGLACELVAVLFFTAWPFLFAARFRESRWAWYSSALAGPFWFLSMRELFVSRFGSALIGLLPLALGVISIAALARARSVWPAGNDRRKSAIVWYSAVACAFVSVAIPLQLEKHWITVGWALEGFAALLLWRRLDHPGLKYLALLLLGAVAARLVLNPSVLEYYPRSGWPVLNWLLYTYWIAAGAMLGGALLLQPLERQRLRSWEKGFYGGGAAVGAAVLTLWAILVVFVWINLSIADWFGTGPYLTISWERLPAKDLATSIAWAVYALILLAVGMKRDSGALRWVSLFFLVLTIGKVFLYDLGQLKDLYRVISLLGLALSLIAVSLAYQRFVFRRASGTPAVAPRAP